MFIVPAERQNVWSYWGQVPSGAKTKKTQQVLFCFVLLFSPSQAVLCMSCIVDFHNRFQAVMRCISTVRFKKSAQAHKTNRSCVPDCFSGKNKGRRLHVALNVDNAPITCTVLVSSHPRRRQTGPGPLSPALRITYWTVSLNRAAPRCNFHLSNKC